MKKIILLPLIILLMSCSTLNDTLNSIKRSSDDIHKIVKNEVPITLHHINAVAVSLTNNIESANQTFAAVTLTLNSVGEDLHNVAKSVQDNSKQITLALQTTIALENDLRSILTNEVHELLVESRQTMKKTGETVGGIKKILVDNWDRIVMAIGLILFGSSNHTVKSLFQNIFKLIFSNDTKK
jgi:methyl-accepting chemotaxis protein